MRPFVFVTGNVHKWLEAELILGRPLDRETLELDEIQAPSTREVALAKASAAYARLGRPLIVEDAGLGFAALGGFPGPFIKFWEELGGLESICRALDGFSSRAAVAVCQLGVATAEGVVVVEGRVEGTIAPAPRGQNGFGWDAIFIPYGQTLTLAEMTAADKAARSPRRLAWETLSRHHTLELVH